MKITHEAKHAQTNTHQGKSLYPKNLLIFFCGVSSKRECLLHASILPALPIGLTDIIMFYEIINFALELGDKQQCAPPPPSL